MSAVERGHGVFRLHRGRVLAVGLLCLAVLIVAAALVLPFYLLHRHYDTAIESMQGRLATYRRVAAQTPELKKSFEALRARDGRRFFLQNTAANLAGAELQDMVTAAVQNSGGRTNVIQVGTPKDDERFRQIQVTVQLFATSAALQKLLYAIETQVPYLIVDNITLRPINAFRGFKPAPGQEPEINVQLDVTGFAQPEPERK